MAVASMKPKTIRRGRMPNASSRPNSCRRSNTLAIRVLTTPKASATKMIPRRNHPTDPISPVIPANSG